MESFQTVLDATRLNHTIKTLKSCKETLKKIKGNKMIIESLSKGALHSTLCDDIGNTLGGLILNDIRLYHQIGHIPANDITKKGPAHKDSVTQLMQNIKTQTNTQLILASIGTAQKGNQYILTTGIQLDNYTKCQTVTFDSTPNHVKQMATNISLETWKRLITTHIQPTKI